MKTFWLTHLLLLCTLQSPILPADSMYGPYDAAYVNTVDGDTVDLLLNVYPGLQVNVRIRERRIDTPELHAKPKCERAIAVRAAAFTQALMENAKSITVIDVDYGTFQPRMIGTIFVDAHPLGILLKDAGLAVDYADRKKTKWC